MPHNANGNETAYTLGKIAAFGGHAKSVLPDVSRLIFADGNLPLFRRTFSPSVSGTSAASSLHVVCLTESGAQPPTELALLLLALPLLLTLQKLADEPA